MRLNLASALCLATVIHLGSTPTLNAQKGGKPKPTDTLASATFRCATLDPDAPCVPQGHSLSDAITGDGLGAYVGVGDWASGHGAFLRAVDGEFSFDVAGSGRRVFLDFRHQLAPPSGTFFRKTFDTATLEAFHLNTNVINPSTGLEATGGMAAMPIGASWDSRIKAGWVDTYGILYNIRFNPDGFPGSTYVTVTRHSQNVWTIEASEGDIARLVSPPQSGKGKPTGPTDEGQYSMPFKITVTVP